MPRVKRGVIARKKKRTLAKMSQGYRGARHKHLKSQREAIMHALAYGYRDRRVRKRDFRRLWITRINAAARQGGLSYNRLMAGLKQAGIEINRKVLAEMAVNDINAFQRVLELARGGTKAVAG